MATSINLFMQPVSLFFVPLNILRSRFLPSLYPGFLCDIVTVDLFQHCCNRRFRMLASPIFPPPSFSPRGQSNNLSNYKPAKDIEAFKSLLPPPIEFLEGSSSGALAVPEGKYEPINASPKAQKAEV